MKLCNYRRKIPLVAAAAFGRLCVETSIKRTIYRDSRAAAFGRLCVETISLILSTALDTAAAFGRLCVETIGVNS